MTNAQRYRPQGFFTPRESSGAAPLSDAPATPRRAVSDKVYRLDLSTARTDQRIPISGNVISVIAATATADTANLQIRLDNFNNDPVSAPKGYTKGGVAFACIYVTNDAVAGQYVDINYLDDPNPDNTLATVTTT